MRIEKDTKLSYEDWLKIAEEWNNEGRVFGAHRAMVVCEAVESLLNYQKTRREN